jgi:regulator of chromosome condensation
MKYIKLNPFSRSLEEFQLYKCVSQMYYPFQFENIPNKFETLQHHQVVSCVLHTNHILCLTRSGTIFSFGKQPTVITNIESVVENEQFKLYVQPINVVKISGGIHHSACLRDDGQVFAWGTFLTSSFYNLGLKTIGQYEKDPIEIFVKEKVVDIASGSNHLVILGESGKIYTIGDCTFGQLGRVPYNPEIESYKDLLVPQYVTNDKKRPFLADSIWVGFNSTFFQQYKSNGKIFAFGCNKKYQLGIVSGQNKEYQTFYGNCVNFPTISVFSQVEKIAIGQNHVVILDKNNQVYMGGIIKWKEHFFRMGTENGRNVNLNDIEPYRIESLKEMLIIDIECGPIFAMAVSKNGKVYGWNTKERLQYAPKKCEIYFVPRELPISNVRKVTTSNNHTLFMVDKNCIPSNRI